MGPLAVAACGASSDRVLLVGDAVGYVDGITGGEYSGTLQRRQWLGLCPAVGNKAGRCRVATESAIR